MKYLEAKKLIHSDLAARNVLVAEEKPGPNPVLLIKVADFGLARLVEDTKAKEPKSSSKFFTMFAPSTRDYMICFFFRAVAVG